MSALVILLIAGCTVAFAFFCDRHCPGDDAGRGGERRPLDDWDSPCGVPPEAGMLGLGRPLSAGSVYGPIFDQEPNEAARAETADVFPAGGDDAFSPFGGIDLLHQFDGGIPDMTETGSLFDD